MALNAGVALAHDNGPFPANTGPGDVKAPVGSALGFVPGIPADAQEHPGLRNMSPQVVIALGNNPNCPLHWMGHP